MLNDYCSTSVLYRGLFTHYIGSEDIIVNNSLITTEDVAEARARSEFIKGSYDEKWIEITSEYIQGLKQNDIISFKNKKFIVKEIELSYKIPELLCKIKAVRYE